MRRTLQEDGERIARIAHGLVSSDRMVAEAADRALRAMGNEAAVETLLTILRREKRRRKRFFWRACLFSLSLITIGYLFLNQPWLFMVFLLSLVINFIPLAATPVETAAMRRLASMADLGVLGILLDALVTMSESDLSDVREALTRLLPQVRAGDAEKLREGQKLRLYAELEKPAVVWRGDYCIAVLKALEQIGDARTLPVVEKLAQGGPPNHPSSRVQRAAQECLPYLRERARRQRESDRLLRPASAPEDSAAVLLRPAPPGPPEDPARLLRPAGGDENSGRYDT